MINKDKWIQSLPNNNSELIKESGKTDEYRWINTIPKEKPSVSIRKYSLMCILFVCGLLLVSIIKNETRNLEKEINELKEYKKETRFNLEQANLDNEVITSPENISLLAEKYLDLNLQSYKKFQIKQLGKEEEIYKESNIENNTISKKVTKEIAKKIEKKKTELKKLQELYSKPETIPGEVKTQVAKKIETTKTELKNLYTSPKKTISTDRIQRWAAVQVVKVFLGVPIIPGR